MNRLRNRLIFVFILATLLPVGLTVWTTLSLLELSRGSGAAGGAGRSFGIARNHGRELYRASCEALKRDAAEGRIAPRKLKPSRGAGFLG